MIKCVRLGEIIDIASGQVDPKTAPYCDLPHVGSDNIESNSGQIFGVRTARDLNLISGKYEFGPSDVLYSKIRPALNKVALPDFRGICSADMYPLRPRPERVERRYLAHVLRHRDFLLYANRHSTRTNIPKINREALLAYELTLPRLCDQARIADILDKAAVITCRHKEVVDLTEKLLRSIFLEMFGDPVTNPKGWPIETIENLCDRHASLVDGPFGSSLKPEHYVSEGVKVVRNWNINDDRFDASEFKFVTPAKFEEIRRSEVIPGDVLITTKGTVGDVCVAPDLGGPAVLSASGTVRLRVPPDGTYLPEFIVAQMTVPSFKRYLHTFEAGSAQQYLNLSAIRRMRLIRPPTVRQRAFSLVRERVRETSRRASAARSESSRLFESLTEHAFSAGLS